MNTDDLGRLLQVHGVLLAASGFLWTNWIPNVQKATEPLSTDSVVARRQRSSRKRWFAAMGFLLAFELCALFVMAYGLHDAGVRFSGSFNALAATGVLLVVFWVVLVVVTWMSAWKVRPWRDD